jgi:hypothetical protein
MDDRRVDAKNGVRERLRALAPALMRRGDSGQGSILPKRERRNSLRGNYYSRVESY